MFSCLRSKPFGTNVHAARALSTTPRLLFDVGSSVPAGLQGIHENSPGNPVDIGKELSKGSFIVVGLPAAFSPACSATHVPGYIKHLDQFKAKGISQILVTTVNDSFVTKAWADQLKCPTDVRILADTRGEFAKAAGHVLDGEIIFGNKRSTRYAAIVKDGKVTKEFVEPDKIGVTVSSAESVLKAL